MTKVITPAMLISYEEIPANKKHLCAMDFIKNPEQYGWYWNGLQYIAHRKPTINEMRKNRFS